MLKLGESIEVKIENGRIAMVWYIVPQKGSLRVYVGAWDYKHAKLNIHYLLLEHVKLLETAGFTNTTLSQTNSSKKAYFRTKDQNGKEVCGFMTKFIYEL